MTTLKNAVYDVENASQAVSTRLMVRTTKKIKNLFEVCCQVREMERDDVFCQLAYRFCLETAGMVDSEFDEDELKAGVDRVFKL